MPIQNERVLLGHGLFHGHTLSPSYPHGLSLKDFTKLPHHRIIEIGLEVGGVMGLRAFSTKRPDDVALKGWQARLPVALYQSLLEFANAHGLNLTGAANILYVSGLWELGQLPSIFDVARPEAIDIPPKYQWGMNRCNPEDTGPASEFEEKRGRGRPGRVGTVLTMLKVHPLLTQALDDFGGNPVDLIERWFESYAGSIATFEDMMGLYDCRQGSGQNPAAWRLYQLRLPAWLRQLMEEDQRHVGGTHSLSFLRLMVAIGKL